MKKTDAPDRIGLPESIAGGILGLLTFFLPLKFASLAVMPEATGFFPDYWSAYLLDITWPAQGFGLASGAALFFALVAFGRKAPVAAGSPMGRSMLLLALGLPLAALPGLIRCDTLDYGVWMVSHLVGIGAYLWAVYLVLAHRPEWRNFYIGIVVAAAFFVVYSGLRQYFFGFEEMRQFARQQYEDGIQLGGVMNAKLDDDRVFATFASCNTLAGYLILLLPVAGYALWRAGDRFEPQKVSRPLLAGVVVALLAAVLFLTRGRGALLAAVLAAGGFAVTLPMRRAVRLGLLVLAMLAIVGGVVFARYLGRGFGSVEERIDYLRTTAIMAAESPLAGEGWGGFFYRHMQLKTTKTDEAAHDPHNIVASFSTQAGVPAGLLVAFALCYPLAALGRRIYRREADGMARAIFWGEVAFLLHALMDNDLLVPANMALSGGLLLAALAPTVSASPAGRGKLQIAQLAAGLLLGVAAFGGSYYTMRAEIAYNELLTIIQPQTADDLRQRPTPDRVARALEHAVAWRPYSPFPWESAGDFYLAMRDYAAAGHCFAEAQKRTTARPSTFERLSRIERARGNRERAGQLLLEAVRRFPGNPKYSGELSERYPEIRFERK